MKASNAELEVLAKIIELQPTTAVQVGPYFKKWDQATVTTMIRRLTDKGMLSSAKSPKGRAFMYSATAKGKAEGKAALKNIVKLFFGGDFEAAAKACGKK